MFIKPSHSRFYLFIYFTVAYVALVFFLRATRSIERISYGNVAGWLGGCLSQPVLFQND